MTSLLIFIKHRCPWIWRMVERVNGHLFALRCPEFGETVAGVLDGFALDGFRFSTVSEGDIVPLSEFLKGQPAERLEHFDPHGFDCATLHRLHENPAFAMMKIADSRDGRIVGYFFLRCFFVGRAFHGLVADSGCAGRGLGAAMWSVSARICAQSGLRMLATVSERNAASLASARRGSEVTVVERLADGYVLIECKPKKSGDDDD